MGTLYIGSFIGYDESKHDWVKNHTETWERNIHIISKTMGKYPQESYAMLVRAIQSEWVFLQYVTDNTGDVF